MSKRPGVLNTSILEIYIKAGYSYISILVSDFILAGSGGPNFFVS